MIIILYKYVIYNIKTNECIKTYENNNKSIYIESIISSIKEIVSDKENILYFEYYVYNGDEKIYIAFSLNHNNETEIYFSYVDKVYDMYVDEFEDYIKNNF